MARPAPATERTIALLNFLTAHADESFTLSELSRRLELNKATGHAMLAALVEAGYVLRHPLDKTFTLGPALVAAGNAAAARHLAVVDYAREEMRALREELGLQCVASAAMGDEMVLLAATAGTGPLGVGVRVGERLPLVPPFGTVFMAWAADEEIDRWLRRLGPDADEAELHRYRDAVAAVRRRGYSIGLDAEARVKLGRALARGGASGNGRHRRDEVQGLVEELSHEEYILLELDKSASYRLSLIGAPVFGADGSVVLALTLLGFTRQLAAEEVPVYGDRLLAATGAVTKAIHGREP